MKSRQLLFPPNSARVSPAEQCSALVIAHVCPHHEKIPPKPQKDIALHNVQSTDDTVLLIEVEEKDPPAQDTAPIREMRGRTANTTLENDQHCTTEDALYY